MAISQVKRMGRGPPVRRLHYNFPFLIVLLDEGFKGTITGFNNESEFLELGVSRHLGYSRTRKGHHGWRKAQRIIQIFLVVRNWREFILK